MKRRPRAVDIDFVTSAPVRLSFTGVVSAAPEVAYAALVDDTAGWRAWFPSVTLARPHDDGEGREIRLRGGARFDERIVLRKPSEVYAYHVTRTNVPGLRALLEEWRLTPAGPGTRLQWTIAGDGSALFRTALRLMRPALTLEMRAATRALDRRLAAAT